MLEIQGGQHTWVGICIDGCHRHGAAEIGRHAHAFEAVHAVGIFTRRDGSRWRRGSPGAQDSSIIARSARKRASEANGDWPRV